MLTPRQEFMPYLSPEGFHQVAYREWGNRDNPKVLICVHGVSRNGCDFDDIAAVLAAYYRVICVDMPGRGRSDWINDKSLYTMDLYVSISAALIARSGAATVHWLGTSMGGRIGMNLASRPNTPITKLVLNDMGPYIEPAGRKENFANFGTDPRFADEAAGIAFVRSTTAAYGPTSEDAWLKFCKDSLRELPDGQWTLHYDPGLKQSTVKISSGTWDQWEQITCPVFLLWGLKSKLLVAETADRMKTTGPRAQVFEVPYAGHCPRLENDEQISTVRDFLIG
ncbi:MAG: alpha/beta fold hydrolase [Alphaproteobacteria bacterium]|jgi:pimeloyl-ACP methyl ester carboxylesterase